MTLVPTRGLRAALIGVASLLAASVLGACSEPTALLLSVSAERKITSFDFTVRDVTVRDVAVPERNVAETRGQALPADQDISAKGKELKLAVRFADSGTYLVHLVGHDATGLQVGARAFRVAGTVEARLKLVAIPGGGDQDADGFPSASACAAMAAEGVDCAYADCNDNNPRVNPLATERCNGYDDDCDGALGEGETDVDGDGFLACMDCNPDDENDFNFQEYFDCRDCDDQRFDVHPASRRDATEHPAAREDCTNCGDGVDHNCDGKLNPCNDTDCDGYPGCGKQEAPPPPDCDCNDNDGAINPGATDVCGDQIDNNCNGKTDEGCMPCDVDGDGFLRNDPTNGCNPEAGKADCDDTDSGIFPGATSGPCGGKQGGCREGALRGYCQRDALGQVTVRDCALRDGANTAKCDAADPACQTRTGCPSPTCDGDGDGFMKNDPANGCNPPAGLEDCDDADPHTFPGAPDRCGDGKKQNCSYDSPCTEDADGDGYNAADDCNDADATVHPWGTELCNGNDDDCDGMTDEGNPDATTGATVAGTRCTDNDVGECSKKEGACICSRLVPVATINVSSRRACKDEDLEAAASPRCFGAAQPQQETANSCDGLDEDCDGTPDDATGEVPCLLAGTACKWTGALWKCACDTSTGCSGCCNNTAMADSCVPLESVSTGQCGLGGQACHSCSDANVCTTDSCGGGVCQNDNLPDGQSCSSGQCRVPTSGGAAVCCGTCWLGDSCAAYVDGGCGGGGGNCAPGNTSCGNCRVCNGAGGCGFVPAGEDTNDQCSTEATSTCGRTGVCDGGGGCALYPSGTSCALCRVCDGYGSCGNVANGQDPNNECTDEGGCGHDGLCNGSAACRYYPGTKSCGTCSLCNGTGACSVMPADDPANCGSVTCPADTSCRNYSDITTNRCKSLGACKTAADCTFTPNSGARCGTCQTCDAAGSCTQTPADDSACGSINCDGLDALPCADFLALTTNRCKSFGVCKAAPGDCTSVNYGSPGLDCGLCVGCNGTGGCTQAIGDDGDCGTIKCSDLNGPTSCRTYSDLTSARCKGVNTCKQVNTTDCTAYSNKSSGTDCGLCVGCNGSGGCNQAIGDDADCGTIACSTLSSTCRTYSNLTSARCKALNTCKQVNTTDCTDYANANADTDCGVCQGCNGSGSCVNLSGRDPNHDCAACQVCNGSGGCRNVTTAEGDPKGDCTPEAAGTCGHTGDCDGNGNCAHWDNTTECGTGVNTSCGRCDGNGACSAVNQNGNCASGGHRCCNGVCCANTGACAGGGGCP